MANPSRGLRRVMRPRIERMGEEAQAAMRRDEPYRFPIKHMTYRAMTWWMRGWFRDSATGETLSVSRV